jgi:ornithine carbamoyltransferase
MKMKKKRDLLSLWDLSADELCKLIERAEEFRLLRQTRTPHATRPGHVLGMVFEKASTRTRASFEIASFELGGHAVFLGTSDSQMGRGEPMRDTARVLSRYCHAIMIRTFGQARAEEMALFSEVPVINGLTDLLHPCQLLADLQTVFAHFGRHGDATGSDASDVLRARRYAWVGDGNNMANSWIEAAGLLGLDLALACPPGFEPDAAILARARATGHGRIEVTADPTAAVAGRHVVSTDVFASMGQEAEAEKRVRSFAGFMVNDAVVAAADPRAIILHCLPAHRGEEIAESVIEGKQSQVWQQAENRLHAQKALLEMVLAAPDPGGA